MFLYRLLIVVQYLQHRSVRRLSGFAPLSFRQLYKNSIKVMISMKRRRNVLTRENRNTQRSLYQCRVSTKYSYVSLARACTRASLQVLYKITMFLDYLIENMSISIIKATGYY